MTDHSHLSDTPFPRAPLLGAGALIAMALVFATVSRIQGTDTMPPTAPMVASADLLFKDRPEGGVAVYRAGVEEPLEVLVPGKDGFMRSTMRGFARERKSRDIGPDTPFRLTYWQDGRLTLEDAADGRRVDLEAFGPTNAEAFMRFLPGMVAAK